ncbi:MAG: hypothetical protein V3W52_17105 [Syntrophobacteria bacterium]
MPRQDPHGVFTGLPIYPHYWYYGVDGSDRNGVISRMRVIPEEQQQQVADEFDRKYLDGGRELSNDFLDDEVDKRREK